MDDGECRNDLWWRVGAANPATDACNQIRYRSIVGFNRSHQNCRRSKPPTIWEWITISTIETARTLQSKPTSSDFHKVNGALNRTTPRTDSSTRGPHHFVWSSIVHNFIDARPAPEITGTRSNSSKTIVVGHRVARSSIQQNLIDGRVDGIPGSVPVFRTCVRHMFHRW
jgi:hypothetical protein